MTMQPDNFNPNSAEANRNTPDHASHHRMLEPLISLYQDGEASSGQRLTVERYLNTCAECRNLLQRYGQLETRLKDYLETIPEPRPLPRFSQNGHVPFGDRRISAAPETGSRASRRIPARAAWLTPTAMGRLGGALAAMLVIISVLGLIVLNRTNTPTGANLPETTAVALTTSDTPEATSTPSPSPTPTFTPTAAPTVAPTATSAPPETTAAANKTQAQSNNPPVTTKAAPPANTTKPPVAAPPTATPAPRTTTAAPPVATTVAPVVASTTDGPNTTVPQGGGAAPTDTAAPTTAPATATIAPAATPAPVPTDTPAPTTVAPTFTPVPATAAPTKAASTTSNTPVTVNVPGWIAYVSTQDGEVHITSSDGAADETLSKDTAEAGFRWEELAWSHDARWIAAVAMNANTGGHAIYIFDTSNRNSNAKLNFVAEGVAPVWSPNDLSMAFLAEPIRQRGGLQLGRPSVVNLKKRETQPPVTLSDEYQALPPQWFEESNRLLIGQNSVVAPDGTPLGSFTLPYENTCAASSLSPYGNKLAILDGTGIVVYDLNKGVLEKNKPLTRVPVDIPGKVGYKCGAYRLRWTPSGRSVYFYVNNGSNDITCVVSVSGAGSSCLSNVYEPSFTVDGGNLVDFNPNQRGQVYALPFGSRPPNPHIIGFSKVPPVWQPRWS